MSHTHWIMTFHSAHIHIHNGRINLHGPLLKQQGCKGLRVLGAINHLNVRYGYK